MNVEPRTALFQRGIDDFGDEYAAAAVEIDDLARQQPIPCSVAHAPRDDGVEDRGARRGQRETALPAIGRRDTVRRTTRAPCAGCPRRGRSAADRNSSARLLPRWRAAAASSAVGSPLNARRVIVKSLPFSAPRFSLRRWRAAATTSKPSPATPTHASPIAERAGTVNDCSATASRSFRPAKPTSRGSSFASRASCFATHNVFAPRLRTFSSRWSPSPSASQPSHSCTRKSSGAVRSCARPAGPPCAHGSAAISSNTVTELVFRSSARSGRSPGTPALRRGRRSPVLRVVVALTLTRSGSSARSLPMLARIASR